MPRSQMPPTGPDGFIRIGEDASGFLEDHLKTILAVVGVVVVLVLGWVAMERMYESGEVKAQATLAKITAVYPGSTSGSHTALPESTIRDAIDRYKAFLADDARGISVHLAWFNLGQAYEAIGDT